MAKKILIAVLAACFTFPLAAQALDYSAEIISASKVGKEVETRQGKAYFSTDKWRSEMKTDEGEKGVTIVRRDKGVIWILMPGEKMYMEQKLDLNKLMESSAEIEKKLQEEMKVKVTRAKVGGEKISGILCDKYKITSKSLAEKDARTHTMYQWVSRKYKGLVMKTAFEDGSYFMLKNVIFKNQPPYLFEVPKGYEKFTMGRMRPGDMEDEEMEEEVEGEEEDMSGDELREKIKEEFKMEMPIKMPF